MCNIFFEFSSTYEYLRKNTSFSGIQRVVTSVAAEVSDIYGADKVFLLYYDGFNYRSISASSLHGIKISDAEQLRSFLHPELALETFKLGKYSNKKYKLAFHKAKLNYIANNSPVKFFEKTGQKPERWNNFKTRALENRTSHAFENLVKSDDIIVSLDASWTKSFVDALYSLKRQHKVKVLTMVHDLIPIMAGFTTVHGMQVPFINWLERSREYTDIYLANSHSTKTDLDRVFKGCKPDIEVETLQLAQSLPASARDDGERSVSQNFKLDYVKGLENINEMITLRSELRFLMEEPYVLCVGTLEIRKNIYRLARAWEILAQKNPDLPLLVFAGRRGWGIENFDHLMRSTGNLSGRIAIIDGPSDEELATLYKNCQIFTYPSLYEGWGLPVGEALSYGKTGVISLNSSLPEVGEDLVEYCDARSITSIATALEKLIFQDNLRKENESKISQRRLRSWNDVGLDLIKIIDKNRPRSTT